MTFLVRQSYGKHRVRVSKINRAAGIDSKNGMHEFFEASVDIELEGDFASAYTDGNNRLVVATDTCRNTVYVLAKDDPIDSLESFGLTIANHFLNQYSHVNQVTVGLQQHLWHRLCDSPHGFMGNDAETPTATIVGVRTATAIQRKVIAGISNCMIAKTTASGFANFHRDEFRTLPDTDDRILATSLTVTWDYSVETTPHDFNTFRDAIRKRLLETFLDHYSHSVQETLYRMATAAIECCSELDSITLTMPNKHHIRFNLEPFGRINDNDVFVVTDEPFGYITATIARRKSLQPEKP